ncbi:MAG: CBS domain-containing protein, partial [Nitrospira sp.]|nr:CBS domain-containing protein [Nitrospira sp.]
MFVSDWMTKKVFTISPDDSLIDAASLLKEKKIKHLPVLKDERIVGILSDRDIKDYSPSKSTSLDIFEIHYLLAKTQIRDVMKTKVITTTPDTPIEVAAILMNDHNIGCLPVIEKDRLVGIISDRDIFKVLVDIMGARQAGHRVYATIEDRAVSIKEVVDVIRKYGFRLQSVLTSYAGVKEGLRKVVIRTKGEGD